MDWYRLRHGQPGGLYPSLVHGLGWGGLDVRVQRLTAGFYRVFLANSVILFRFIFALFVQQFNKYTFIIILLH